MSSANYGMSDSVMDEIQNRMGRHFEPAGHMHKLILEQIKAFEDHLRDDEEVGIRLPASGSPDTFRLTAIGFKDPHLLAFQGEQLNGRPIEILQHHTQFNLLLIAVPKVSDDEKPRRIGFIEG